MYSRGRSIAVPPQFCNVLTNIASVGPHINKRGEPTSYNEVNPQVWTTKLSY